ncbi:glycosyltransferase family 2 protein [Salipiger mangrovisoli]|uniref:Glycosyltransferase family 2 protein n=1 Tax=Salipiger mangrovisoli TaxID=2865933 RepID=A0ABR9X0U7_9RHOB|nr:glycosyltransferase family 2 protein [Salipiger mangrovisoli]MBE9637061.1 glycosyltransferase family 2 protein [Salipiger mangrovisoli]
MTSMSGTPIMARLVDPAEILVAIPTLNEEAHIARTLEALLQDSPQMRDVRIIVADGGSTDRTVEIVEAMGRTHPNIRVIHNPLKLQSAAVNLVVETCADPRHSILVRVDAHSHYRPGYVLQVADSLREHEVAGLATVMDSVGPSCFQRGSAWAMETKLGSGGSAHRGGAASQYVDHGHHAGFDLAMYRRVGGYDTGFIANEDAEYDHRVALAGGRIWLDAGIRLDYVMRPTLAKLAKQYRRYGQGRAQTLRKHRMRPRLRQIVPPIVVAASALSLLLAPVFPWALAVPALYLAAVAAMTAQTLIRKRSLCALWVGPALVCMHFAWGLGFLAELAYPSKKDAR